ncbi:hypothetical protein SLEP1_g4808 [Rubroshorea leprosula]|uniref:Reverse transcriptase domain-containing protein n=1 Tax=Rubroshorea leprosula TaxID=152421 RepID=A0AAV5HPX4_9ROSI|nr:hypothetical protein SLEP1_g4808 [Rubroshorea leprosula]
MDQTRILAWNCRGLGDTSAISELKKLCFQHKPSIIFLSETKRTAMEMTSIRPDLGFDQCFAVDCVGRGGGLAMLWRDDFSLTISTFSQSHIDVEIVDPGGGKWRLTGFYGRPEAARREESWTLLKSLKAASSQPWLCLGDFNEILRQSEKAGGNQRPYKQMEVFAEALNFCDFKEMGFKGPQFTFIRKMHDNIIKERLDRVLMNPGWSGMFPGAFSHHLLALKSDHAPILVIATKTMNGFQHKRTKLFRFENYWIKDPDSQDNSLGRMEALEQELNDWQRREEVLWKQRSRVQWLKEGDKNTAFFHNRASARHKKNHIAGLLDDRGSLVTDKRGVEGLCIKYFRDLFTSKYTGPNSSILSALQGRVSPLMANNLDRDFTSSESAFVPGRLIYDNIMVAIEAIHHLKNKKVGRRGHMAIKLDLSKAFDKVEWNFLEDTMRAMGFPERWINRVMTCVRTVEYSVLINGCPTKKFTPSRGIRQGDPLSLFLFLLCAEGLSALLSRAIRRGDLKGLTLCRGCPCLSHLFFADDSLLFGEASVQEATKLLEILKEYEGVSGQQINLDKSSIFFSSNTSNVVQQGVMQTLNISKVIADDKYLGLPLIIGRKKAICFDSIRERVWSKIKGWKTKLLSRAGREILIKAVVQAIPTYCMGCFKLPQNFLLSLNSIISNFWWGDNTDRRRIHWLRWDLVCKPKRFGGLGFRDFRAFNLAMLAKQSWRLMQDRTTLCYQILRAKYFPNGDVLGASVGAKASMVWRGVVDGLGILKLGFTWRIGTGQDIRLWRDNWLPSGAIPRPRSALIQQDMDDRVSAFIDVNTGC